MAPASALLLAVFLIPLRAADEFLGLVRKADSRSETEEKVEYYNRAIRAWSPVHAKTLLAHCHFRRGEAYFMRFELDRAEPDLTKAVTLDPRNARAFLLRGRLNIFLERFAKAARDFAEYNAVSAREEAEGYWRLGEAERLAGRGVAAQKALARALELDPEDYRPPLGQARMLLSQSQPAQALEKIAAAHRLSGKADPEILALKGRAGFLARALSLAPEAVADLNAAIDLFEARLTDHERSGDALGAHETRSLLAPAYHDRAEIQTRLQNHAGALSDHKEACRLGHRISCVKADRLSLTSTTPKKTEVLIEPEPRHAVEKKTPKLAPRKKRKKPDSDPDERVYIQ